MNPPRAGFFIPGPATVVFDDQRKSLSFVGSTGIKTFLYFTLFDLTEMIVPPFLKPGDQVGIVAPAGKVRLAALDKAAMILSSWGYHVHRGEHLHSSGHTYFSGRDDERLKDMQWAFDHPHLKAVFCARGGYGTTRIIDGLNLDGVLENPKWLIGFSDITSLHLALHARSIQSIHGIMPSQFPKEEASVSLDSLRRLLGGHPRNLESSCEFNLPGVSTGVAIGGNLSLVVDSLGTSLAPDTQGKILIIEEIDEYAYKIDRMLVHLKRAGLLQGLAGLVIGYMTGIENSVGDFGEDLMSIVLSKVKAYGYPVAFNFPVGHEHPNIAWIHGSKMTLKVTGEKAILYPGDQETLPQPPPPGV